VTPDWLQDDLKRIEDLLLATAGSSPHPMVSEASTHLIKAGGKRVRPTLVMLAARAGETGVPSTDLAAAAIELVHLATLYHDDVIDETETRRGAPTVHSKWGTEVAVLSGDYLFALGCGLGADAGGEVPGILARAIAQVCEGQIIETGSLGDPERSIEQYLHAIERKTAALFRAACELGAATAGAPPRERAALVVYGESLGLAFQVVDDLLDLVGDPQVTGKVPGTDLREGVFTLPVLLGRDRDDDLRRMLVDGERDLEPWLAGLRRAGALEETQRRAEAYAIRARSALDVFDESPWRAELLAMVDRVMGQL
jgi:heptaprenyl diphosphate synthase